MVSVVVLARSSAGRSLTRYFFGLRGVEGLTFATFLRSRRTSSRSGMGISCPFGVRCFG